MHSTLYFHGGAGTVTGANFLLDTGAGKILVDCGLMQGRHTCEDSNWEPFPYNPKEVSHLVITHAHIDHIGRIPKLVKEGFRGVILSTPATKALAEPLLRDAMEILGGEAERCGKPELYGEGDITRAMSLWKGAGYHEPVELGGGVSLELLNAGHILGSSMVRLRRGSGAQERVIVFTGDLGGGNSPLLAETEAFTPAHYLVVESVYGNRVRREDPRRREELENVIEDTAARGGTLLIPAFSTERTQDLLFEMRVLMGERRVPSMPVFLDSPLAQEITAAYLAHPGYFSGEMAARVKAGEKPFSFPELRFVKTPAESARIEHEQNPKIILAGSGMSSGGRVISHERWVLPDSKSTLLIVGYQAAGSLGRQLLEGAKKVTLFGRGRAAQTIPVRARVASIFGYSAHMDGEELLEFINKGADGLEQVFAVEGEPASSGFLAQRVRDYLGTKATAPEAGEKAEIEF